MKLKLRAFYIMISLIILSSIAPASVSAGNSDVMRWNLIGSWYGQYQEPYFSWGGYKECYDSYMNMTISECDENGAFSGEGYVVSLTKGSIHDGSWARFTIAGNLDFDTGAIEIRQVKQLSSHNYSMSGETYRGTLDGDTLSGFVRNDKRKMPDNLTFSFGRVSEWAKDEVTNANSIGLIPETIKGKDLSKPVTRAEFAAIAVNLYESLSETEVEVPKSVSFTDISGNDDEDAIKKANSLGIAVGISATKFLPNEYISREDIAAMLCRTIKKYKYDDWTFDTDNQYALDVSGVKHYADDAEISDYAKPSVYYLTKLGIMNGIENSKFAPKNTTSEQLANNYATATREQAVTLAYRIFRSSDI